LIKLGEFSGRIRLDESFGVVLGEMMEDLKLEREEVQCKMKLFRA